MVRAIDLYQKPGPFRGIIAAGRLAQHDERSVDDRRPGVGRHLQGGVQVLRRGGAANASGALDGLRLDGAANASGALDGLRLDGTANASGALDGILPRPAQAFASSQVRPTPVSTARAGSST